MVREPEVIAAAQRGDLGAFNRLVLEYQGLAYNVAHRLLGDPEAAADATQDSFLKAYKALHRFQDGSFKAWFMRILTNTCYDELRVRQRRRQRSLDDVDGEAAREPWLVDHRERPGDYAERRELGRAIQRGLWTLPDDQRVVVVLSDVEGFSYEEIAQVTGVAMGTVKSRLSRARARLRDYLLDQGDLLPPAYRNANHGATAGA